HPFPPLGGIHISTRRGSESVKNDFLARLEQLGLDRYVMSQDRAGADGEIVIFQLREHIADDLTPNHDTTRLCQKIDLDTGNDPLDLEKEILLAMLASPAPFPFPSHAELSSSVRMRKNIVAAARKTLLSFDTCEAERPESHWTYVADCGFTLLPKKDLITALTKATQPDESGRRYSFSCYRASEYIILLGIAQELKSCNPELLDRLQDQCGKRAILSGEFHEVFLREYGSMSEPLPPKYWVPGDRTWFRNPDDHSSDVTGYEGSWVIYLGDGLFSNFWKENEPYSLTTKCIEIFHWRNATYRDQAGELKIDEAVVEQRVRSSLQDPAEVERILDIMLQLREPQGVYVDGGCIDTSREYPRWVCSGTSDLALPEQ
ncbi:MAG TPA: hypothetical protein VFW59_01665, partial [Gallionella sp.]|nr:hypothetical protein [Gallionella sp.]